MKTTPIRWMLAVSIGLVATLSFGCAEFNECQNDDECGSGQVCIKARSGWTATSFCAPADSQPDTFNPTDGTDTFVPPGCGDVACAGDNDVPGGLCDEAGLCALSCDTVTGTVGDCDGELATGCETDLASDAMHCGACGVDCATELAPSFTSGGCVAGGCEPEACLPGFHNLTGALQDGCPIEVDPEALEFPAVGLTAPVPIAANTAFMFPGPNRGIVTVATAPDNEVVISIVPAPDTGLSEVTLETALRLSRSEWAQKLRATVTEPAANGAFVLVLRVDQTLAWVEIQSNGNTGFVRTVPIGPAMRDVIATRRLNSIFDSVFDVFVLSDGGDVTWATIVENTNAIPDPGSCVEAEGSGSTPWLCEIDLLSNLTATTTPFPGGAMLALGGRALLAMGWDTQLAQAEVDLEMAQLVERPGIQIDAAPFGDLIPWPASETADRGLVVESSARADPEVLFLDYSFEGTALTRSVIARRSIVPQGASNPAGITSLTSVGEGRFAATSTSGVYLFSESDGESEVANVLPTVIARELVWSGGYLWMILREASGMPETFARLPVVMHDRP